MRLASYLFMVALTMLATSADGYARGHTASESTCLSGPWAVSFEKGSATLSSENREILNSVLANAAECGDLILIEGYPNPGGALRLERERVLAVFQYLAEHGLSSKEIRLRLAARSWPSQFKGRDRHVLILFADPWSERDAPSGDGR